MSSDLAMTVKARAMFGARLKEADYESLLQKKSVSEIAAALKHDTYFKLTLEGINEKAIHRQQLEALLRMDIYSRLTKLQRYSGPEDSQFVYAFVMRTEVQLILICVRWIMTQDEEIRMGLISKIPMFARKYLSFDIQKLPDVNTFDDLIELLHGTEYEKIIEHYKSEKMDEIDYIGLEHDMEIGLFKHTLSLLELYSRSEGVDSMNLIIRSRAELMNISSIYRMKKYFRVPNQRMEKLMLPFHALFSEKELRDLIENGDENDVLKLLEKKYHRYAKDVRFTDIENYIQRISFNFNHTFIEYNTEPALIMMSYLLLSETEIQNIINIIEGVRYQISPNRIRTMLVY